MDFKKYIPLLVLMALIITIQLLIAISGANFYLTQITMSIYYSLVIIGLCLLMGYTGQISLGHAGFFAIGGYTTAVMSTSNLIEYTDSGLVQFLDSINFLIKRQDLYGNEILSFSPWIGFFTAIIITIGVAFLIGIPVLRLKGHYLAMATLGFGIIVHTIVIGTDFLGLADGIRNIPGFTLIPGLEISDKIAARIPNYYIACFFLVLGVLVCINLINSRVGRALRSIHDNESAANALGVNTGRYKLHTFVLSAVFASIGGVLLTHYNGGIGPSEVDVIKSVRYVAIVAVGGMDNLWGALSMGILLNFISLRGLFGSYDDAFFGFILIVIMLFIPRGLLRKRYLQTIKNFFINLFNILTKKRI